MKTFWRILFTIITISVTVLISWALHFVVGDAAAMIGILGGLVCFTIWDN